MSNVRSLSQRDRLALFAARIAELGYAAIPIRRCLACDCDVVAIGVHACRPETPAAPDLSTAGSR